MEFYKLEAFARLPVKPVFPEVPFVCGRSCSALCMLLSFSTLGRGVVGEVEGALTFAGRALCSNWEKGRLVCIRAGVTAVL
jgi:hypothetical protein